MPYSGLTLLGARKSIRPVTLSDEVLTLLSVWSKLQIVCLWSSWCHVIPKPHRLLPHLNPDWFYLSGTTGLPRLSRKRPLNGCCSRSNIEQKGRSCKSNRAVAETSLGPKNLRRHFSWLGAYQSQAACLLVGKVMRSVVYVRLSVLLFPLYRSNRLTGWYRW